MDEPKSDKNKKSAPWSALRFAWELGYLIAIPLVIFALGGAFVDRWLGTKPWFLITGVMLSIIIYTLGVFLKAVKVMAEQARSTPPKKEEKKDTKE